LRGAQGADMEDERDREPCYVISVAARLVSVHPQTLRYYERLGLVEPTRSQGNLRMYSPRDIERLHYVSTCYVSGRYPGLFTEAMLDQGQTFNNFYEATKYLAEVLVQRAAERPAGHGLSTGHRRRRQCNRRHPEVRRTVLRPSVATSTAFSRADAGRRRPARNDAQHRSSRLRRQRDGVPRRAPRRRHRGVRRGVALALETRDRTLVQSALCQTARPTKNGPRRSR